MDLPSVSSKRLKQAARPLIAAALASALLGGYLHVASQADAEAQARKSPTAQAFERSPADWLAQPREISDFQRELDAGELQAVAIAARDDATMLLYTLKGGAKLSALVPACSSLSCSGSAIDNLASKSAAAGFTLVSADVDWRGPNEIRIAQFKKAGSSMLYFLGMALFFLVAFAASMKAQSGSDRDSSKPADRPKQRFDDVVGAEEAKAALRRVGAFMTDPTQYLKLGANAPRGVLLKGPAGTGKTLLAKALAGESGARFIAVDGSYFTSMFFGMGILKVRKLFRDARKHAPCIIFIDEIDGIGQCSSGPQQNASSTEMNRIINHVLVEMDGFSPSEQVIVIGATNYESNLDPALRRAGRFDMIIAVELPTVLEREQLFRQYIGKVKAAAGTDAGTLARMTAGMSPADIANTVNKATSTAAENRADGVTQEHLIRAVETFQLGGDVSSTSKIITEPTRRRLAVHEAGHALVAHLTRAGKVERVSIEPRGGALGATYISRESEEPLYAHGELSSRLAMMLAGREAELMIFGDVSSGASDDLKRATELAISMVATLGFSEAFGLLSVAGVPKELLAPQTQEQVLQEAREMLSLARRRCSDLLGRHKDRLNNLADGLLGREVVSGPLLDELLGPSIEVVPRAPSPAPVALPALEIAEVLVTQRI